MSLEATEIKLSPAAPSLRERGRRERVTVVIPCHNEAAAIGETVAGFRRVLPAARILVVDNASSDDTAAQARSAGAEVIREPRRGKGFALLTGFRAATGADFVVMVDGDGTYPPETAIEMLAEARKGAEMVVATRLGHAEEEAFRRGHRVGNRLFISIVRALFGIRTRDLFSGYRVLSKRFLSITPLIARGFEVEAELALQAAAQQFRVAEVSTEYRSRHPDNPSKLRTYRDGYQILVAILVFFRDYRPLTFFGVLSLFFLSLSLAGGSVVIAQFIRTGLVMRLPLAVLAAALFIMAALSMTCGVLLSSINRRAAELAALLSRNGNEG